MLRPLQDMQTNGFVGFLDLQRVLQAQWVYSFAGILKLLWPLQDIRTDRLMGFTGLDRVLSALFFRLMSFGKLCVLINMYRCFEQIYIERFVVVSTN